MLTTDLLEEELKMLIRATRNERFRFIVIQNNHFSLIETVKKILNNTYPNRAKQNLNIEEINQDEFISSIINFKKGIIYINNFEKLFKETFKSLAIGFNQRRDRFSDYPIIIIAFLPWGENYLQDFQKTMPDLFSLCNPIIQLEKKLESIKETKGNKIGKDNNLIIFRNSDEALNEIIRVKKRLKSLEKKSENLNLIYSLFIQLAEAYKFVADYNSSLKIYSDLLNSKEKLNLSGEQNALLLNDIGTIYTYLGKYKKSIEYFNKSLELRIKINNLYDEEVAIIYNNIGESYNNLKKYNKSIEFLNKGLNISLKLNNGQNIITNVIYGNLGLIYSNLKDYEKAEEYLTKDLNYNLKIYGENDVSTAISYANIGALFTDKKEYQKALEYNQKALNIRLEILNKLHPDIANSYNNIGAIYSHIGDYENAKKNYLKALYILEKNLGKNHPNTKFVINNIALLN